MPKAFISVKLSTGSFMTKVTDSPMPSPSAPSTQQVPGLRRPGAGRSIEFTIL